MVLPALLAAAPLAAQFLPKIFGSGGGNGAILSQSQLAAIRGGVSALAPSSQSPVYGPPAPGAPMEHVTGEVVVKQWQTVALRRDGSQAITSWVRLANGTIIVQPDGKPPKRFRPRKHIVISSNPRVGQLVRANKRLHKLTSKLVGARRESEQTHQLKAVIHAPKARKGSKK